MGTREQFHSKSPSCNMKLLVVLAINLFGVSLCQQPNETVGDQLGEFETQNDIEDTVEPEHYGNRDAEPITGSIPAAAGRGNHRPHYGNGYKKPHYGNGYKKPHYGKRNAKAGHHGYGYGHYKPHYGSHGHSYKKPHYGGYGHHYGKRDAVAASA